MANIVFTKCTLIFALLMANSLTELRRIRVLEYLHHETILNHAAVCSASES
jgi:hypothetical protein